MNGIETRENTKGTLLSALVEDNPTFVERYAETVAEVEEDMPTAESLKQLLQAMPEEYQEKVIAIVKKMSGKRKGKYGEGDVSQLTELKLYHDTGNDPNRPDKQLPGE